MRCTPAEKQNVVPSGFELSTACGSWLGVMVVPEHAPAMAGPVVSVVGTVVVGGGGVGVAVVVVAVGVGCVGAVLVVVVVVLVVDVAVVVGVAVGVTVGRGHLVGQWVGFLPCQYPAPRSGVDFDVAAELSDEPPLATQTVTVETSTAISAAYSNFFK